MAAGWVSLGGGWVTFRVAGGPSAALDNCVTERLADLAVPVAWASRVVVFGELVDG